MKKIILLAFIALTVTSAAQAQSFSLFTRGNVSIGSQYNELDYFGNTLFYSGGGGMGLEIGSQIGIVNNLRATVSFGYQLNLAFTGETVNDVTTTSSALFGRSFVGLGLINGFELSHRTISHILVGAGVQYNSPSKLRLTENDVDLGSNSYSAALGFYFEGGISLKLSDNLTLDPTIRYRSLSFEVEDNQFNAPNLTDERFVNYNANGVEFALTLVRAF
ncbi:MAG: hypothetical protein AAFQ94_03050 [Bacteroidota bacterium]